MADLDSLNIKINASATSATNAIDKLKHSLSTLSSALDHYLDEKEAVKGLTNLADGLEHVTAAISNLDTRKLREISQAMNGLSRAAANLDKAGNATSKLEKAINIRAKKQTEQLAQEFDLQKSSIKDVNAAVKEVYKTIGNDEALSKAKRNLEDLIKTYLRFIAATPDQIRLLKELERINKSGQKVQLPAGTIAEAGDDYRSARATLGKAFTSGAGIMDIDEFVAQMNNSMVQVGNTAQDTFTNLVNAAKEAKRQLDGINFFDLSKGNRATMQDAISGDIEALVRNATKLKESNAAQNIQDVSNAAQNVSQNSEGLVRLSNGLRSMADVQVNAELGTNLGTLSNAVSRLGTPTAEKGMQVMYQMSGAVNSMNGIVVPQIGEQLSLLASGMAKLGGKYVEKAAYSLPFIADGLKQLAGVEVPQMDGLTSLADGISRFGYAKIDRAITNMPTLTKEIVNLINTVKKTGDVSRNVVDLTRALADLSANASKITGKTQHLPKIFSSIGSSAKKSRPHVFSLASAIGKVYAAYWMLFRFAGKLKEAINISSDLTEVQNVVDNVFGNMTKSADDFAKSAINNLGMSELQAKQMASRFQAMGKAMQISNKQVADASGFLANKLREDAVLYDRNAASAAGMSLNLTRLAADMASFYNVDYEEVADDLASVYTGMSRPLRRYGLDLTENTLREYAMKNGLDANIKSMTQAQKTLLRYQYVLSNTTAAQGDFARTAHTWANQVRILKQNFIQLGAIIGTAFINSLKPMVMAFNNAFNTILDLAQKAVNALGKLLGWQIEIQDVGVTFDDAADGMDDYTDATEDAADAQEKLNSNLQAFDKLNVLTTKKDNNNGDDGTGSGSGNGGGSQATGGGVRVLPYESDIDSWYDFGKRIAETIADALWNIDWDKIKEGARNIAHNIAEFINGFIDTDEFWTGIGHTIAEALNTALTFVDTLLTDIKWGKLGQQIGNLINQAVDDFDWKLLGKTIADGINAASSFVLGLATTFDASALATGITDAINSFFETWDPETTAEALNKLVDKLEEFIATALGNLDYKTIFEKFARFFNTLEPDTIVALIAISPLGKKIGKILAQKLSEEIAKKLGTITLPKITLAFQTWAIVSPESFVGALSPIVWKIDEGIKELMDTVLTPAISEHISWAVGMGILGAAVGTIAGPIGILVGAITGALVGGINGEDTVEKFKQAVHDVLNVVFAWDTVNAIMTEARENMKKGGLWLVLGLVEGLGGAIVFLTAPIFNLFNTIWNTFCELFQISSPSKKMAELGVYIFLGIVEGFKEKWDEWTTAITEWYDSYVAPWFTFEKWNTLFTEIWNALKSVWDELASWWETSITDWWDTNVAPWFTYEKWYEMFEEIKNSLKDVWDETAGQWISDIQDWWDNDVSPWFTFKRWDDLLSSISDAFQSAFEAAAEMAIEPINSVISAVENMVNGAIDGLNKIIDLANKVPGVDLENIGHVDFGEVGFANGGYPAPGLFIAGEAGPELVGTIGGRTAVVNNDQIVQAVSAGVAKAVAGVLGSSSSNQELVVNLDGREVYRSVVSHDRQFKQSTGHSAFNY
jgi:hypothetical protein